MISEMLTKPLNRSEQDDLFRQMDKWLMSHNGELTEKRMLPSELENIFRMRATILALRSCPDCGGSGVVDSGGVQPWGASIDVPCTTCSPPQGEVSAILNCKCGCRFEAEFKAVTQCNQLEYRD